MCYNVFTIKINLFEYKRFKHGRCTYKNTGSSHLYLRKLVNPKIASKQTQSTTKEKNSDKKKHLGKIHVFLITICIHWNYPPVDWGEWGARSVTCGAGQRSREGCGKSLNPGQNECPQGHVRSETERCSMEPCIGKLRKMASMIRMIRNYHCLEHNQGTMVSTESLGIVEKVKHQFNKLFRLRNYFRAQCF